MNIKKQAMIKEIQQIPDKIEKVYEATKGLSLPAGVPYLGMGASYFASLSLYYQGVAIWPDIASEYFHYIKHVAKSNLGVLISQSGKTSEVNWCRNLFENYIAITNTPSSKVASGKNIKRIVPILAGKEKYAPTKTYLNTLIALYNGHKIESLPAIRIVQSNMTEFEDWGKNAAKIIHDHISEGRFKGIYLIGNGPNISTAKQGALVLSETTKYPFIGMPVAQYDHGAKETAKDSIVIVINTKGPSKKRTESLFKMVKKAGATVIQLDEERVHENLAPITAITPINFLAYHLSAMLNVKSEYTVGKKETEVD